MTSTRRLIPEKGGNRLLAIGAAALLLVLATGCVMTTVSMEEPPSISQSRAKRDLGVDYLSAKRTGMAIRELRSSLELDPSDPQTHLWMGEAYRRKGQTEKAEVFLIESVRLAAATKDSRTEQQARLSLSALLSQMGRYADSLEHCEAVAADPTFSTPWKPLSNCGWALLKLGRLDEARTHFETALDYFPNFGAGLMNLAILEAKEGHRLAAIKLLQKALDSGRVNASGYAEANYRLGELFVALGRRDTAIDHFREAAKVAPGIEWGSQSQAYLDLLH
jgi:Tfp pilus assembly protein PilF